MQTLVKFFIALLIALLSRIGEAPKTDEKLSEQSVKDNTEKQYICQSQKALKTIKKIS